MCIEDYFQYDYSETIVFVCCAYSDPCNWFQSREQEFKNKVIVRAV